MCVIHYYTFMFACTNTKRTGDSVCTDGNARAPEKDQK